MKISPLFFQDIYITQKRNPVPTYYDSPFPSSYLPSLYILLSTFCFQDGYHLLAQNSLGTSQLVSPLCYQKHQWHSSFWTVRTHSTRFSRIVFCFVLIYLLEREREREAEGETVCSHPLFHSSLPTMVSHRAEAQSQENSQCIAGPQPCGSSLMPPTVCISRKVASRAENENWTQAL